MSDPCLAAALARAASRRKKRRVGDRLRHGETLLRYTRRGHWLIRRPCGHEIVVVPHELDVSRRTGCGACGERGRESKHHAGDLVADGSSILRRAESGEWVILRPCGHERTTNLVEWAERPTRCATCDPSVAGSTPKWKVGDLAGPWRLLELAPVRGAKGERRFRAICTVCEETTKIVTPALVVYTKVRRCRACEVVRRHVALVCRSCGATDPKRFGRQRCRTECPACSQAALRNGRCECGRAVRLRSIARGEPCACGRKLEAPRKTEEIEA